MKIILFVLFFPIFAFAAIKEEAAAFNFQSVPFSQVVSLYFDKVNRRPYVLCDEVLNDQKLISIRASCSALDAAMFGALLDAQGYSARDEKGVTVICKRVAEELSRAKVLELSQFVYRTQYRDSNYLAELLSPMFPAGVFANRRGVGQSSTQMQTSTGKDGLSNVQPSQQSRGAGMKVDDFLLFSGSDKDIVKLEKIISQVDVAGGEVLVKGYVYEVSTQDVQGSALKLLTSVLSGKLSLSIGADVLSNALKFKTGSIDLVASALNTDTRFKMLSSPLARVRNGDTARFVVGQEVPILSAIVTGQNGQLTQSYERRDSGVIFEVTPMVRSKTTDVDLFQQLSNFVKQDTGTSTPPILNKREMRTSLSVDDGELIVIGGLNEIREERNTSGFWFVPLSKSADTRSSELLLILELKRI